MSWSWVACPGRTGQLCPGQWHHAISSSWLSQRSLPSHRGSNAALFPFSWCCIKIMCCAVSLSWIKKDWLSYVLALSWAIVKEGTAALYTWYGLEREWCRTVSWSWGSCCANVPCTIQCSCNPIYSLLYYHFISISVDLDGVLLAPWKSVQISSYFKL